MRSQPVRNQEVPSVPEGFDNETPTGSTRLSILDVTYDLLTSRGYAAITTDDIAAAAQVSKATMYRLWRTKQQLVVDAARMHFGKVEAPDLGSFRAEVHWILEHRARDYRDAATLRLVAELVGASVADPQLKSLFEEWVSQLSDAILRVVERGMERGDVRLGIEPPILGSLIAGIVARIVVTQHSFSADEVTAVAELISAAAIS